MMLVARESGFSTLFVGAKREPRAPEHDTWDDLEILRVGRYFPLVNGRRPLLYLWSVLSFGFELVRKLVQIRPAFVHVSDIEPYWFCRIYGWVSGAPIIYNVHDNLSQRYRWPESVAKVANIFEGLAVKTSACALVPEQFRADALPRFCRHKVVVVRNGPVDPGYCRPEPRTTGPVEISYAGWIDEGRGLSAMLSMARGAEHISLRLAGTGAPRLLAELEQVPNIHIDGAIPYQESLARTAQCDFVVALYEPSRVINRYAASNQLAEALAVGRPPIVNAEMKVAALLAAEHCAVIVPYDEAGEIGAKLTALRRDQRRYEAMCRAARRCYELHYAWATIRTLITEVYTRAGVGIRHANARSDGIGTVAKSHPGIEQKI